MCRLRKISGYAKFCHSECHTRNPGMLLRQAEQGLPETICESEICENLKNHSKKCISGTKISLQRLMNCRKS